PGRRRVEVPLGPVVPGSHEQVRLDQHAQHAGGLVALDEADAAHVGGQVEDAVRALDCPPAGVAVGQGEDGGPGRRVDLVPRVERLDVDGPHVDATVDELGDQVAPEIG